jgi:hypothetical protein
MLAKKEIKDLTPQLIDYRKKLLHFLSQTPLFLEFVENGRGLLLQLDQILEDLKVELPEEPRDSRW